MWTGSQQVVFLPRLTFPTWLVLLYGVPLPALLAASCGQVRHLACGWLHIKTLLIGAAGEVEKLGRRL